MLMKPNLPAIQNMSVLPGMYPNVNPNINSQQNYIQPNIMQNIAMFPEKSRKPRRSKFD